MTRSARILAPSVLALAAFLALWAGLAIGGAADPRAVADPGAFIRVAVPVARLLVNLSLAGLIGSLVMVVWALANDKPETKIAMDVAAASGGVLTVASGATLLCIYIDLSGLDFSLGQDFGAALAQFVTTIEVGQQWLFMLILAATTTVLAFAIRDRRLTLLVLAAALILAVPLALQGHSAGASDHSQAVNSLLVHLIGASVWLGGLFTLVMIARVVDRVRLKTLTERYSTLALLAFIGVSVSGVVSAALRVGSWQALLESDYGTLVILKTISLVALGAFGVLYRGWAIRRMESSQGSRIFLSLVLVELAVMGIANGLAGALGRSATPVDQEPASAQTGVTPAEYLVGDPLPPELTPDKYLTEWKPDTAWALVAIFGLVFYLAGVWRLARRGDRWPIGRTIAWSVGMLLLLYTTNGPLNAYQYYLFSTHMLAHMMLTMLIPLVLVLGAPVTLALRAIRRRDDGSWGGREWIQWMVQTPFSRVVTHPIFAAVMFAGSLWVFYFSPLFRWAMEDHLGHQWMIIHFLISGYLFALSMIGVDPVPYRFPYPLRIVTLFATMASHAFFGVSIMTGNGLMLADWFGAMGRTWGADPVEDQHIGGGIAWGIGELPTVILALTVAVQWSRSDAREQKRKDRAADRSGDEELRAYNEMLEAQAKRDARS